MIPFFPHQISLKSVGIYLGTLAAVSLLFFRYATPVEYTVMGLVWIMVFFGLTAWTSRKWYHLPRRNFIWLMLALAVGLRVAWVVFSYYFYQAKTGIPFEFEAADAREYHADAAWLATTTWHYTWDYLIASRTSLSDSGYLFYLSTLYRVIGPGIMSARLVKAVVGAAMCWLLYRLAARTLGETTGRMTGLMAACMPNLIIYCGLHLKETEMLFLTVAFLERADALLRSQRYTFASVSAPLLLGITLFTFRTVLGAAALFAFISAVLFSSGEIIGRRKRLAMTGWIVLTLAVLGGGTIANETEGYWESRGENQAVKREQQTQRGNRWAKYATGTVMAPMMFVLPFPTMVDVEGQYNQNILHAGNFIRNLTGGFVVLALFNAFFRRKDWRNKVLAGSFMIAYLTIISMSGFANSERFLLPGLPLLLLFAADGIAGLNAKSYRFIRIWYWIVPVMAVAWAFFKVGSRGLL
ncbi:MAG: hypothetical protein AUK63_933 [bacterium P3]|nr:MAG: hypothetical protein AUK64_1090 [bacterium P201]KWW30487.1 MAG: hypothetical protein AUK63_933 [bacterium P3]KWW41374.1 MAG: hypothetical protein F083_1121 [bacterium F083]